MQTQERTYSISEAAAEIWNSGYKKIESLYQVRDPETGALLAACAIGAACYFREPTKYVYSLEQATNIYPELNDIISYDSDGDPVRLAESIFEINDSNRYNTEDIILGIEALGY